MTAPHRFVPRLHVQQGNRHVHERAPGYRDRPRVPGPILPAKPEHEEFGLIAGPAWVLFGLSGIFAGALVVRWLIGVI